MEMLQYLEQFNLLSVFVRLALATVLGGWSVAHMVNRQDFVHLLLYA